MNKEHYLNMLRSNALKKASVCAMQDFGDTSFQAEVEDEQKFLADKRYEWVSEAFNECDLKDLPTVISDIKEIILSYVGDVSAAKLLLIDSALIKYQNVS